MAIAMACGGEPGARLANRLGMASSGDRLLRILHRTTLEEHPVPRILGVDDFAFRRRHTFGTILCDLETRRPIDLLPDRSKESFRDWLSRHPGVEVISRDRGDSFTQGATEGAPQALQVADRWHLLANLRDAVTRWLARCSQQWKPIVCRKPATSDGDRQTSVRQPSLAEQLSGRRRERRIERYQKCRELHQQGLTNRQIGRALGLHEATVHKFIEAESFPERAVPVRSRLTDAYADYLKQRWHQGCHNARVLYEELCKRGFTGSYESVCRSVSKWRVAPRFRRAAIAAEHSTTTPRLTADQLAWLLVQAPKDRSAESEQLVLELSGLNTCWSNGIELARMFPDSMRNQSVTQFDTWIERALGDEVPGEIRRFARGLYCDLDAVRMAFNSPWSNGQTEWHVNRLKMIKRQMYGRAGFDLLRIRFLLPA